MNTTDPNPLDEKFAEYETWLSQQPLSRHTKRAYQSRIRQFLKFMGQVNSSNFSPSETVISRQAVLAYTEFLKNSLNAEPTSVNNSLTAIDHFCQFLGMEPSRVRRERAMSVNPRTLTLEEQARFLQAVESRRSMRDRAMSFLFFYAGVRPGECAALNVNDLVASEDGTKLLVPGNNGRDVLLNDVTSKILEAWLKERDDVIGSPDEEALFVNAQGRRLSTAGIDLIIRGIGWTAKLDLSAQVLRHTCLANLANNGSDLMSLAQIAGHKSLDTTRRYCGQGGVDPTKPVQTSFATA
jgi:site-specific recombinase XerD